MNKFFKLALLGAALVAVSPALGQGVNSVAQVGTINNVVKQQSYVAVARGLAPAASATDIFCITGSSTKSLSIKRVEISGTAGTLVTAPFTLLRRITVNTGGTAATGAALPVAAPLVSTNAAATAVLTAYTANPTITDSSPTYFRSQWLTLPTTAAGVSIRPIYWDMAAGMDILTQGVDIIKGNTTYQYCINLNGVTVSTGLLDINMYWTEN